MNFSPLLGSELAIRTHAFAAVAAVLIGAVQFTTRPGVARHRALGYAWVAAMLVVTLSSFLISARPVVWGYGYIHILSILTIVMILAGVVAARRSRGVTHGRIMTNVYVFALVVTGLFTLLPGRLMYQVVFG